MEASGCRKNAWLELADRDKPESGIDSGCAASFERVCVEVSGRLS